jgi:FtsP/CotA-like multicopper oxidase with cupredoxin domain
MDRRQFLRTSAAAALAGSLPEASLSLPAAREAADSILRIGTALVEVAPQRFLSMTAYNGQFPGPLLRFKEGRPTVIDIYNDTDTPEQLHWHGQLVPASVDGAAEERTPDIPAHSMRRERFVPGPSGFRFYHTHVRAGSNLDLGQYGGEVGPVYIEPAQHPGAYDREVFLTLKEFEPFFSQGGDMAMDFLSPGAADPRLRSRGERAMRASLARGMKKGFEVGYRTFTINGRQLGFGEPVRVRHGERVLFHILNGSATEIRSLALPGHRFKVHALDGNPVPHQVEVPVLWLGTAERVSAIVEMDHPGVWVLGDLDDGDRGNGMGIVVEYAGAKGKPVWTAPPPFRWDYRRFAAAARSGPTPEETIDFLIDKDNAAQNGFNRWTLNGTAFDFTTMPVSRRLARGRRYRLHLRNATDDIHPIHVHRTRFELARIAGSPTAGLLKDVVMLGGYQAMDLDFTADEPGLVLFHCHSQLHMDFGFMALFETV